MNCERLIKREGFTLIELIIGIAALLLLIYLIKVWLM